LLAIDPGFDPAQVTTVGIDLPQATYPDGQRQAAFFAQLEDRLRRLPAVSAVGATTFPPLGGPGAATRFTIVGRPAPKAGEWTSADIRIVDQDYFTAMRIPLLRGRGFTRADGATAPPVVIVSEAMARRYWAGSDPLGTRLQVSWTDPQAQPEIIGVVGDIHVSALDEDVRPMIYYVEPQSPSDFMTLVVRHRGDAAPLIPAVRAAVRDLDPNLPLNSVGSMEARLVRSMADRRYPMLLLSGFAALALALAAVGLYGVLSYTVGQRRREFGVRIALGAPRGNLLRMVVGHGMRLTLVGIVIGTVGAALGARALGGLLYGVPPVDPVTFLAVGVVLAGVALMAAYFPARRATGVDPMAVLRSE
jgi:putative ABC transport system permease protein